MVITAMVLSLEPLPHLRSIPLFFNYTTLGSFVDAKQGSASLLMLLSWGRGATICIGYEQGFPPYFGSHI
jgi:hypothetical protein